MATSASFTIIKSESKISTIHATSSKPGTQSLNSQMNTWMTVKGPSWKVCSFVRNMIKIWDSDIADSINTILTKLKYEPDEILLLAGGQFDVHIFNQMLEDANKAKWSNEKGMINQRDHGHLMKYLDGANLRVTMAKIEGIDRRLDRRKEISGNHIHIAPMKEFATRGAAVSNIRPIREGYLLKYQLLRVLHAK